MFMIEETEMRTIFTTFWESLKSHVAEDIKKNCSIQLMKEEIIAKNSFCLAKTTIADKSFVRTDLNAAKKGFFHSQSEAII